MFTIILIMATGVAVGYLFRRLPFLQGVNKSIPPTIWLLLLTLGVSVGSNPLILSNLGRFGWQAAILAVAGLAGSMLAAQVVYRLFFRKRDRQL